MGGSPKTPKPVPVPTIADPAIEEARRKELQMARQAKGRSATLLASQEAMAATAPVGRKTLLGA